MGPVLLVMRHAKAEAEVGAGGDHARALKGRGRRAARASGRFLAALAETPELVLSSDAARAAETARLVLAGGGWLAPLELRPAIYAASAAQLLKLLAVLDARLARVLLVGHQPGLGELIGALTGGEPEFPTAALARIDLLLEGWAEIAPRRGRLAWLVTPGVIAAGQPPRRA